MITVTYDGQFAIELNGHARQAPKGEDIVCAGASVLIVSLACMMERHQEELLNAYISIHEGRGIVRVRPSLAFERSCKAAFETAICGFQELALRYSAYIQFIRS